MESSKVANDIRRRLRLSGFPGFWIVAGLLLFPIYLLRELQFGGGISPIVDLSHKSFVLPARILVAFPLFWIGRITVERATDVAMFELERANLIGDADQHLLQEITVSMQRMRNHTWTRIVCVALALMTIPFAYTRVLHDQVTTLAFVPRDPHHLAWAGWWYCCVSAPLYMFVALRALAAWVIWTLIMFRLQRFPLRLLPTHPDNAGGIGFISLTTLSFIPTILATGVSVYSLWLHAVMVEHHKPAEYLQPGIFFVGLVLAVVYLPFVPWVVRLARARAEAMYRYGALGAKLALDFDHKWIANPRNDDLLMTADSSALEDYNQVYSRIEEMRLVPVRAHEMFVIALAAVLPALPLLLLAMPAEQLAKIAFGFLM